MLVMYLIIQKRNHPLKVPSTRKRAKAFFYSCLENARVGSREERVAMVEHSRRSNKGVPPVRLDSAAEWQRCMNSCQHKKDKNYKRKPGRDATDADARKSPPRQQQETPRDKKPKGPKSVRRGKKSKSRKRSRGRSLGTQTDPVELGTVAIRHPRDHETAVELDPEGSDHEETFRLERPTTAALAPAGVESILPPQEDCLIAQDDFPTSCERVFDEPTSACKKRKGSRGREADKRKRRAADPTSSAGEEDPPDPIPESSAVKDGMASMMEEIERQRAMLTVSSSPASSRIAPVLLARSLTPDATFSLRHSAVAVRGIPR